MAPSAHHRVVQVGPHLRGVLDSVLAGEAQSAFRSAAPAGLLLDIEEDEMCMRVRDVVSGLVMYRGDISSDANAQTVSKSACQSLPLLCGCFCWEGHHEPLTDAPLAPLGLFLGQGGGLGMGGP